MGSHVLGRAGALATASRNLFDDTADPIRSNVNPRKNESHVSLAVEEPAAGAKKNLPQMVSHLSLGGALDAMCQLAHPRGGTAHNTPNAWVPALWARQATIPRRRRAR